MTAIVFSDNQPLTSQGDTYSSSFDMGAKDAPSLTGLRFVFTTGDATHAALAFPGAGGMLQIMLQGSLDGAVWKDHRPLSPNLGLQALTVGQVLTTALVPPLGNLRYLRIAYRVSVATPTGTISASMQPLPVNRFNYYPTAFEVL